MLGNPWRYRGKRTDKETGLIYFGYRDYDPEMGRWISEDPAGNLDGPNLYAFVHNNPLSYVDDWGFYSKIAENCGCIYHGHPGWEYALSTSNCTCICGRDEAGERVFRSYRTRIGSNIKSAVAGIGHGIVDFTLGSLHDLQTAAVYVGSAELDIPLYEKIQMIEMVEQSQMQQFEAVGDLVMDLLSIDASDSIYQSFRSSTTLGLEIGFLVAGGYGAVKGVIGASRIARMPMQISRFAKSERVIAKNILNRTKIKSYLNKTESLSKNQIISDLESIGLKRNQSPDGRFMDFRDKFGKIRVKIHPPDKTTSYNHLHIYNKQCNSLNKYLEVVERTSVEAHIPYGGNR